MYPSHSGKIINDPSNRTIFDVLKKAHNDGYTNVRIVGGGDRVKEFDKLTNDYNGKIYQFDNVEVLSAGDRDPDSEGTEGMSASKQRKAAAEGDFASFRKGVPSTLNNKQAREIYNKLGFKPKRSIESAVQDLCVAFKKKLLPDSFTNEMYFNVERLKKIQAK